jgi:pSer/pThr/pTyr-binding forkhead associated (FHA) protein
MPQFVVHLAEGKETAFSVEEDDIFIGRVPTINDICINDPSVSRQHAHVKRREEGYTVYDLKSLNGVRVNGMAVSRALLRDGDRIRLGNITLSFRLRGPTADEELTAIEQSERTQASVEGFSLDEITKKAGPSRLSKSGKKRKKR